MANPNITNEKQYIDVIKHRKIWFWITGVILVPCIVAMLYSIITSPNHSPIKLGIDFEGGTILQYQVDKKIEQNDINTIRVELEKLGIENPVIQGISNITVANKEDNFVSIKTPFIDEKSDNITKITSFMNKDFKDSKLVQTNSVGPTLGKELMKNSMTALLLAFLGIVIYITIRFQLDYAVITLLTLAHDAIFVVGVFSIMSLVANVHVDSLFITAILTVIGFSVHDTIVVFDRIRENNRFLGKKYSIGEIINASVNQTLARSINTSLTTLLTLIALYIFGGSTTKDFVLAMILGIAAGAYSSIFFASALLGWWEERKQKKA